MATAPSGLSPPPPASERPENPEERWLRTVYRPGVPQLTVRAVVVGMLLGALMCLSNLYVVLKVGWSFGVTITSCVVAYGLFQLGERLGLVRRDQIFYAKASGEGNPVIYVGSKTGRDGIHGATMASEEFSEASEAKRPNVQVGDPFLEKLLLEACLEAMQTGAIVGIQDMGAAGLTCSTCEMGARGHVGTEIELDLVPQRETGMSAYEIMLSESQERMLMVAQKGREQEVFRVFEKWGLDAVEVGRVTSDGRMRVLQHGEVVADIPNEALTDDAPIYKRPLERWEPPVPREMPEHVKLAETSDLTGNLKRLLASPNQREAS